MPYQLSLGKPGDFRKGTMRSFSVGGQEIAVARVADSFYAFANECSHRQAYLTDGHIDGCQVICAYHEAVFDLATGTALSGPALDPIPVFPVQLDGDELLIEWPEQLPQAAIFAVDHGDANRRLESEFLI